MWKIQGNFDFICFSLGLKLKKLKNEEFSKKIYNWVILDYDWQGNTVTYLNKGKNEIFYCHRREGHNFKETAHSQFKNVFFLNNWGHDIVNIKTNNYTGKVIEPLLMDT